MPLIDKFPGENNLFAQFLKFFRGALHVIAITTGIMFLSRDGHSQEQQYYKNTEESFHKKDYTMADNFLERIFKSIFGSDKPPRVPARPKYTQEDVDYMARTIFGESSIHDRRGRAAVGHAIKNRSKERGLTIKDTVLQDGQFEPWMRKDRRKAMENLKGTELETYRELARNILDGKIPDMTQGAAHFFNPDLADPSWAKDGEITFEYGTRPDSHIFLRHVDKPKRIPKPRRKPRRR